MGVQKKGKKGKKSVKKGKGGKKKNARKKKKKGSKGGAHGHAVHHVLLFPELEEMGIDDLQKEFENITKELSDAKRMRSFAQLEQDQVQQLYEVTQNECATSEANIRVVEAEMEKMIEVQQEFMEKNAAAELKNLEYLHKNAISEIQKESLSQTEEEGNLKSQDAMSTKSEQRAFQNDFAEKCAENEEEIRNLKSNQSKEIQKLREEFEGCGKELRMAFDLEAQKLKNVLDLQRKMEIHEIEEHKNHHIKELLKNHENAFSKMRDYYNLITRDNLNQIKTLKTELKELSDRRKRHEEIASNAEEKNEKLSEPLVFVESEVAELNKKLTNCVKDRRHLKRSKSRLTVLERQLKGLVESFETLSQRHIKVVKEKDSLFEEFEDTVKNAQKKSLAKKDFLSQQLILLQEDFDKKKTQFTEVLDEAKVDKTVMRNLTKKLDEILDAKNQQIKDLKYEIARFMKTSDEFVRTSNARLIGLGIPSEELSRSVQLDASTC